MSSGGGAAGGAGAGAAAAAGGDGGGEAQQGAERAPTYGNGNGHGADVAALAEQLGAMSSGQEEMRQFLMSQPWAQQAEADPYDDDSDDLGLDFEDDGDELRGYDDPGGFDGDPDQMAEEIATATDGYVRAAVAPLANELAEMRRETAMRDLVAEFPDMGDPDIAGEVVQQAHALAEAHGHPEVAGEPWFWRIVYAAQTAYQAAAEEGQEPPDTAHLEGGAGSAGGQRQGETNPLLQALDGPPGGRNVLPF
jgi:hypothetical protein